MKRLFTIFIILPLFVCGQPNKTPDKERVDIENSIEELLNPIEYVSNPNPSDSTCISEIERAKTDIENGKLVFAQQAGFLFGNLRYKKELILLCDKHGLEFQHDMIGCVIIPGQTQGCYGAYMNKMIEEKYGSGFKDELHRQADSILLANAANDTIRYSDCDERPRLPYEKRRTGDHIPSIHVTDLDIKEEKKDEYGGWPFMDLSFIVSTDSTISGFYISNFVPQLDENRRFKTDLFKLAIQELNEQYSLWVPGKINGIPVRSDNNVRVHFVKNEKE